MMHTDKSKNLVYHEYGRREYNSKRLATLFKRASHTSCPSYCDFSNIVFQTLTNDCSKILVVREINNMYDMALQLSCQ